MASIERKTVDRPDESRTPEKTRVDVVQLGDATVARMTLQPGWSWADCIKPVVGTESCQAAHLGFLVSGRIHIKADDGAEVDLGPVDAYRLEPGHHAWVVGPSRPHAGPADDARSSSRDDDGVRRRPRPGRSGEQLPGGAPSQPVGSGQRIPVLLTGHVFAARRPQL